MLLFFGLSALLFLELSTLPLFLGLLALFLFSSFLSPSFLSGLGLGAGFWSLSSGAADFTFALAIKTLFSFETTKSFGFWLADFQVGFS